MTANIVTHQQDQTAAQAFMSEPTALPDAEQSNLFSTALQTWTEIDLPSLQNKLDQQGLELKDEQKSSLLSRKNLAAKTKEFKKLDDSEKLEEFKSLLKLYQNEIDTLSNKKKTVEGYFFGLYRVLAEAPDPKPLLELSVDSVLELSQADDLKVEISKLNQELTKKADYEQLKQRLLRNEQKAAELLTSKLNAQEDEFKSLIDEKESNWVEKEKQLQLQIKQAQGRIEELRTSKEVTELQLNHKPVVEASSASLMAELDIVTRDAESSKTRLLELEKRNEELRMKLSKSESNIEVNNLKEELSGKISEMEGENALLVANLDQTRRRLEIISKENGAKIDSYSREVSKLSIEIKNLKVRLDKTDDYDEIKHELHLLRQIEFGQEDDDEENSEEGSDGNNKIDALLLQRNKTLTQELADYRSQHGDYNTRIVDLESVVQKSTLEVGKLQELNTKLENDLADLQSTSGGAFNDNSSLISGVSRMTRPKNGSIFGTEDSGILPIITKQRDRFRDRNNDLEEELKKQYGVISELKRQMNSLKKDNEELYERTRYLATFNNSSQSFSRGKKASSVPIDLESNPYQEDYESKLHPIEQFRIREQERISSKLSPIERMFVSLTRAILATRLTRMLFMLYCLGLHFIVMFVTIYVMSLHTSMIAEVGMSTSTGGSPKIGVIDPTD